MPKVPTIKGIFVNSHIKALQREKGEEGMVILQRNCPGLLNFKNSDDVPVRDETKILECIVQILSLDRVFTQEEIEYEAGYLHFKNFLTTPLARILQPILKTQFKSVMLGTENIAGHVFREVTFTSKDMGEKDVIVLMMNNDYPLLHFKGFFQAWMDFAELKGGVGAKEVKDGGYEYRMKWK